MKPLLGMLYFTLTLVQGSMWIEHTLSQRTLRAKVPVNEMPTCEEIKLLMF